MEAYTWCLVVLLCVVAIVGIPGNILVMLIYQRKARRLSMNVYISGLAAVDLFVCALTGYRLYSWINEKQFYNNTACQLFTWIGFWSEMLTAFITTAIALDRYVSVCKPHAAIITPVRATISIGVCTIVSGLLSLFSFLIYGVESQECKIINDGLLLYLFATLTFSAFALLMGSALIFYWLVFREVRKRTKVGPRLIEVKPRNESSTPRPEPTVVRSHSLPCSPTHRRGKNSKWNRAHRMMIAKQLEQKLTLVSLATSFQAGRLHPSPSLGVDTVTIRQNTFLTADFNTWNVNLPRHSSANGLDLSITSDMRSRPCSVHNFGSQIALSTAFCPTKDTTQDKVNNQPALRRRRTGKMLLLATVVFVITWTARCIMWLVEFQAETWWQEIRQNNDFAFAVLIILQHIYYTTPAVNPVIYSYVNPRFREDCTKVVRRICRRREEL
ncbi:growth hormone secretagogue receptor type 1-like [Lytechinus variegatus]|uniref:growth hormone secretagogue receptor type 1-like n=1 Tax=Lytechinus variegatus TaxID=7654 RepID=UPI001BB20279|nr:growth hormone secretagogue receptor type 1-like [Lytechinus variegatus]